MPIKVRKEDFGMMRITWTTEIEGDKKDSSEIIHLGLFNPGTPSLKLSYTYVPGKTEYKIYPKLTLDPSLECMINNSSSSGDGNGEQKQNYRQTWAIWGSLNNENEKSENTVNFEKHTIANTWVPTCDGPFTVKCIPGRNKLPIPLTWLFWIAFKDSFSRGEKNALKHITEAFVQQNNCDVQFEFKDQHIGGHISILVARSPVFAAMFQHEMKESKTGKVVIEDVEPHIFQELLYYIYSGRVSEPLTETTAQPLFLAADKYGMDDLKEECSNFMLTCIRVENVINLMAWAHLHTIDKVKNAALSFAALNGKEICALDDWMELAKNYPELSVLATRRMMENMALSYSSTDQF